MRSFRRLIHLPFILLYLFEASKPIEGSMSQSSAAGEDVAAPLCCAQGLPPCSQGSFNNGSRRNEDAVLSKSADQGDAETASIVTGSSARWKRVVSPNKNISVDSSTDVGSSSISSIGVLSTDATKFTSFFSSSTASSNIASSISSTHESLSTPNSAQPSTLTTLTLSTLFQSSIGTPQTPFPLTTPSETLMTISATLPSSASPIGLTATSTSADAGTSFQSTVTVIITLSTARPRLPPSPTMSNTDTITSAPANPTSAVIDSTMTQSTSDTILISTTTSTPFLSLTSFSLTFFSSAFFSPTLIPSTSDFPTPIASSYPSISAISLSSMDDPTITSTISLAGNQTTSVSSTTETGTLSTGSPHGTGFAHRTGAIIGVGIGGTFALLLIILLIFFAFKRCRSTRPYNSSSEDIFAVTRNPSWHPPLEADDDEHYLATYEHPNYVRTSDDRGERIGDDPFSASADAYVPWPVFRGQPLVLPLVQGSTNSEGPLLSPSRSSNHSHDSLRGNTEPLNIKKHNSSQQLPLAVDSPVTAIRSRSASSLGFGGSSSSNAHLGPGSSGEALLARVNTRTSISELRPIHKLSGRRHHSTPPTAFVSDPSPEHVVQRVQQYQEEQRQQDRADKTISQVILARLRASRRPSVTPTVQTYSQFTAIGSEESRTPSYLYSPSLLNPPISISQTVPRLYAPSNTLDQHLPLYHRPDITLPPSPAPTENSSMVEGLLHPRLGMALASSQQASATSLRDHVDYTRPINGLVNNYLKSTTTFETQDTVDLNEEGASSRQI